MSSSGSQTRWSRCRLTAVLLAGAFSVLSSTIAQSAAATGAAHAAGSLTVKDEGHLKLVKSSGSLLIDEGPASGTLPGKVRVHFIYNGNPNVSAQITIYGHSGSVNARATARLSSPTSSSPSFKGALTITGGSGRYAGAHGSGVLYGVFYRRSYAMTVQTQGSLHF